MRTIPSLLTALAVGLTTLALTGADASAATLTQTFDDVFPRTLIGPTADYVTHQYDLYYAVEADQFNPLLGTLNQVRVDYDFDFQISGTTGPAGGSLTSSVSLELNVNFSPLSDSANIAVDIGGPNVLLEYPFSVEGGATISSASTFYNAFIGDGGVFLTSEADSFGGTSLIASSLGTATGQLDLLGGTISLTYDYTPVPEPASAALLALGGLILARRR